MSEDRKEKNFGVLGSVFILLAPVPYIGFLLSLAGIILLLIAFHNFSKFYNNKDIFNKFLIGWILGFIGLVVAFIFGIGSLIPAILMSEATGRENTGTAVFGVGIILAILIFYGVCVISSYFYKQSFDLLGQYTGVNLFNLAGTIIFWGSVAIVLFGLGLLVMYAGWIILAVAFYSIPQLKEPSLPSAPSSSA